MNTPESDGNLSITITMSCSEAVTTLQALEWLERGHRKTPKKPGVANDGKWGHYDCPPRTRELAATIRQTIREEHPNLVDDLWIPKKPEAITPKVLKVCGYGTLGDLLKGSTKEVRLEDKIEEALAHTAEAMVPIIKAWLEWANSQTWRNKIP